MSSDESSRIMSNQLNRKPMMPKYEKNHNYNSNPNYNSYGNSSYNGNSNSGFSSQHPRRRTDRFRRESINLNEKLIKQNDVIIRLLKEIRDRLPKPPVEESVNLEVQDQVHAGNDQQDESIAVAEDNQGSINFEQDEEMFSPGNEK
ncbi:MAG: hypothetical protein GX089_12225 [Fibrobacter sp.]|nr:hypothetical protein [Fibrobacter sp.]